MIAVKCDRCGFDGHIDYSASPHVCRVFVSLDELEALRRDAARYQWLKEKWSTDHGSHHVEWRFGIGCAEVYDFEPLVDKGMAADKSRGDNGE